MAVRLNTWRGALPSMAVKAAAGALVFLLVIAFVAPPDAQAFLGLPSPGEIVKDGVKTAFDFVIKTLFGGVPTLVTQAAISWQLHLPSDAFTDSNVHELEQTTSVAAFACLGLVMTAATLRYWLGGILEGDGGGEAIGGFVRSIAAALGIVAWPWFFNTAITVSNQLTYGLIHAHSVQDDVARMLGSAVGSAVGISILSGRIAVLIAIVIVVVGTVLMLVLFALHIVLACAMVVMFVGGPLVIVLTPFPGTAWMARVAFRAFGTLLTWPVLWALCFAAFAAVFQDFINFKGDGGFLDKVLVKPLTGVAMLYVCVKLPLLATRASMMGIGGGSSFGGFAARYIGVRQLERVVSSRIGGDVATPGRRGAGAEDAIGTPLGTGGASPATRAASSAAGAVAAAGTGGAAAPAAAATRGAAARTAAPNPRASAPDGSGSQASTAGDAAPARLRELGQRPHQLAEQMRRNQREGMTYGLPAGTEGLGRGEVADALTRLGPERAASLQRTYQRSVDSGKTPGQAHAAAVQAAGIGAARAELDGDTRTAQDYMIVGSASRDVLLEGYGLSEAARQNTEIGAGAAGPPPTPGVGGASGDAGSTPARPPAPGGTPSPPPSPTSGPVDEADAPPRRSPHKP